MWEILVQNLPLVLLIIAAIIICGADLIKAKRVWEEEQERKIQQAVQAQNEELQQRSEFDSLHARFDELFERLGRLEERVYAAEQKLYILTESDKHDIKSWIVEQYHKFYNQQGWIDAFSAETIDSRFGDYQKEGGNSYVENLVNQLHTLSMDPEEAAKKKQQ